MALCHSLWVFVTVYGKIDDISSPKEGSKMVLSVRLEINVLR
ncbi:hypothetical protein [Methanobacterium sp. MBAC-LM]